MPRIARKDSESNFYHVMVQGINKEYIFKTDVEINQYKEIIMEKMKNSNIDILAYCIMNNHAHFLIYSKTIKDLAKFMQRLNTSYSRYYNKKNKRLGYVFRDRYKTQEILNQEQLYNCLNYIHNNPVKAKIVENIEEYKHSSYREFLYRKSIITDKSIKKLFGSDENYKKQLINIYNHNNNDNFIDIEENKEDIFEYIKKIEKRYNKNIDEIIQDKNLLINIVKEVRKQTNVTIVKLAEILGVSKSTVENYIQKNK